MDNISYPPTEAQIKAAKRQAFFELNASFVNKFKAGDRHRVLMEYPWTTKQIIAMVTTWNGMLYHRVNSLESKHQKRKQLVQQELPW